jgi:hypothetical protein
MIIFLSRRAVDWSRVGHFLSHPRAREGGATNNPLGGICTIIRWVDADRQPATRWSAALAALASRIHLRA